MAKIFSFILSLIMLIENVPVPGVPTLTVDAGSDLGSTTTRATGFLYGLAENGVPSENITDSLHISSVSQKVPGGLQHPTGDVDKLTEQLDECDYVVVYLQDTFDTWYYCHDEIMQMRKNGDYDWEKFLTERYFPIVREKVEYIEKQSYKDNIVYCIFNECDNAVWFGNYVDGAVHYDDIGKANFYKAWKMTYDLVKSIAPDAKIGGPGFCDYTTEKIDGFMQYTSQNGCVPEIMIYHELNPWSIPDWETHVEDYRSIEKKYAVSELPIIVTEYGCMEDCGDPSYMLKYIEAIENTGTWANMAFWRLANNLNDTCADDNSPNANWWLYRKYAEMDGTGLRTAVTSAIGKKALYDSDWRLTFGGVASLSEAKDELRIICVGSDNKRAVKIENLDKTNLGAKVTVKVECVYFSGLSGIVSSPTVLKQFSAKPANGSLNINIPGTDTNAVYFISVTPFDESAQTVRNTNIPKRYEFEDGKLQGNAYTYDSAYATTGEQKGLVGGLEQDGDGIKLTFTVSKSGKYDLGIIFGKGNDSYGNPQGRDYATAKMVLDSKQEQALTLENTIKSEYTTLKTVTADLCAGVHTIAFYHGEGTYVLDSMLVKRHEEPGSISVLKEGSSGCEYYAVADTDGYYTASIDCEKASLTVDGAPAQIENGSVVYLRRGLNKLVFESETAVSLSKAQSGAFSQLVAAEDIALEGKAQLLTDKYGTTYVDGISNLGGSGKFTVDAPEAGTYRVTLTYANNSEGGVHSYNVDLIERYLTVSVNGESQDIYCRNTYSKFTYKTMTFNLELAQGANEIVLTNSGNSIFNGMEAFAPQIAQLTVNAVTG